LAIHNPWWSKDNWASSDYHLNRLNQFKFVYERENYIPLSHGVKIMFGPRQVGKTTWIKQNILRLTDNKKSTDIFYIDCELFFDRFEMYKTLSTLLSIYNPHYLFIDEITSINEWEKSIKLFVDSGKFKDKCVILTGSSSLNLLKKAERLPGRLGSGQNKFRYYPLNFKEVVKLYGLNISSPSDALTKIDRLNIILHNYFIHGGIIRAINSFAETGSLNEDIFSIYSGWIDGELANVRRSSENATHIMDAIANSLTNEINWHSLVKNLSHPTVAEYVEILNNLFVLLYIEKSRRSLTGSPKNKKVYFYDPFFYWLSLFRARKIRSLSLNNLSSDVMGKLAELSLFVNLTQYIDKNKKENDFDIRRYIHFEKDKKGEIDFAVKLDGKTFYLESKFGKHISTKREGVIYLTKNKISRNSIPLSIFLLFPKKSINLLDSFEF